MKVIVHLTIDDEERNVLAHVIDGHKSKRMASRKDVNAFVKGCLDRALQYEEDPIVISTADQLREQGFDESYIRGWMQVEERYG